MSDHQSARHADLAIAPAAAPAARAPAAYCADVRGHAAGGRDPRARPAAARWTRRAIGSPASSPRISGARRALPINTFATRPKPTKPSRTRSSRSSAISRSYREAWPFEVWFTRILINGCLDRRKARARRDRWFAPADDAGPATKPARRSAAPPNWIPRRDCWLANVARAWPSAIDRLDGRQRTVFMLCHYGDCTPREVSAMTGLNESTVRVHLFRAARKLRALLGGKP